jgi:hypothetical protein
VNKGKGVGEEDLAQWVSLALQKNIDPTKYLKGFLKPTI